MWPLEDRARVKTHTFVLHPPSYLDTLATQGRTSADTTCSSVAPSSTRVTSNTPAGVHPTRMFPFSTVTPVSVMDVLESRLVAGGVGSSAPGRDVCTPLLFVPASTQRTRTESLPHDSIKIWDGDGGVTTAAAAADTAADAASNPRLTLREDDMLSKARVVETVQCEELRESGCPLSFLLVPLHDRTSTMQSHHCTIIVFSTIL